MGGLARVPNPGGELGYNALMDSDQLRAALDGLPLGGLRYFEQLGSTNEEAARWAAGSAPDLALVVADEQTAGRGRQGRRWYTPPGAALAFSLVLQPAGEPGNAVPLLTALGALGASDALRELGLPAQIKWPNDILVRGRKLAGVLVEASWQGDELRAAILGIGINVAPRSVPDDAQTMFPATCIETELGSAVHRWQLLRSVLEAVLRWRPRVGEPGFIAAWDERLAFRGEWVRVSGAEAPPVEQGQVIGLNPDGTLQLRARSGELLALQVGDIHLR